MDSLAETKEILQVSTSKFKKLTNFLFPAKISQRIHEIEGQMMRFVQILSLGVTVNHANHANHANPPLEHSSTAIDFISSESTKKFWKSNFGEHVFSVTWEVLEASLIEDFPNDIDAKMLKDLKLRLDNFNTGSVSVCRLAEFVGHKALSQQLREYKTGSPDGADIAATSIVDLTGWTEEQNINFPILLWVDDKANNKEIEYAKSKGVSVVVLTSTAEAKQWMKDNLSVLENDDPSKLRIITNNVRQGAGTALDINAGEDIVRFVRGRRCTAPILVYCGDLKYTTYTESYDDVTAVNTLKGCHAFIDGLY